MTATKGFATGNRKKSTNEASESVIRKIWMIVELLRHKRLSFERYVQEYERNRRSFQRDLQQLRAVGDASGFSISAIKDKSYVELENFDAKIRSLQREGKQIEELIGDVARAMGRPIAHEIGTLATGAASEDERFFHFAVPNLSEDAGSAIARFSTELKEAWKAKALVRFHYPDAKTGKAGVRLVEPSRILLRSGVFYLVGYDRNRKGWRSFALDRFLSAPERAGSNNVAREIPPEYASDDVLGFIKTDGPPMEVTVEFSPRVAASAIGRRWQKAQRVEALQNGRARIVLTVGDLGEVVRWAFGFGDDATIVAPPRAVTLAAEMARSLLDKHAAKRA